jgi:hypothetical protein
MDQLMFESAEARALGENQFIEAQERLNNAIASRVLAMGGSEAQVEGILDAVNAYMFDGRAQEALGPEWHQTTLKEIIDGAIAEYAKGDTMKNPQAVDS